MTEPKMHIFTLNFCLFPDMEMFKLPMSEEAPTVRVTQTASYWDPLSLLHSWALAWALCPRDIHSPLPGNWGRNTLPHPLGSCEVLVRANWCSWMNPWCVRSHRSHCRWPNTSLSLQSLLNLNFQWLHWKYWFMGFFFLANKEEVPV